jgi:hypothetical protein
MFLVFLEWPGKDEDIVQVGETEVEPPQNVVNKALECLGGVEQAEGHEGELEEAEGSSDGGLLDIVRMDWNLVVRPN